jgi:glycosyltransferase involved in cell wall biosynthesis
MEPPVAESEPKWPMGLGFLLKGVVPALEKKLGGLDYSVHIIGGGRVKPELERYLKNNRIVVHGFVKDLDAMLDKSDAVLVLNNAEGAPQAYTRHLVAWSRGLCLIAHTRSRLAIPEIEPGRNALLGETPEQIAEAVRRALTDSLLNRRLRQQGHQTFETLFVPRVVARNLLESLPTNALPKS